MLTRLAPLALLLACNQPPEGGLLTIEPSAPRTTDDLEAVFEEVAIDPNGKDTVSYTYAWTVDGTAVDDLVGATVPAARTSRDEVWAVTVEPTDGKKVGEALTASTTIENTAPVVSDVLITPTSVRTDDALTVAYTTADADDDTVTVAISWTVAGTEVGTGTTLAGTAFDKGDAVSVRVTPDDGTDAGEAGTAGPVTVLNTAPTVPVATINPAEPTNRDALRCVLSTPSTDADADTITYQAAWELDGVAFTGRRQTVEIVDDTVPATELLPGQVWTCTITADDGEATTSSLKSSSVTVTLPPNVSYRAGYFWVIADYNAPRGDHAAVCAGVGLVATAATVTLTWDAALLGDLAADFGYANAGDTDCCATAMWCWDGGGSPLTTATDGSCETHNFGASYENYGTYSSSTAERPVFTCLAESE